MKNIIFFFGSFDPLHKGHISIIEEAIKKVSASCLYIGLNKSSSKGKLTSYYHRKNMIKEYVKTNDKCMLVPFSFDFKNIEDTYNKIFNMLKEDCNYYILIGQDQLSSLKNWYNYDYLLKSFSFIVAKRGDIEIDKKYLKNPKYIFIDHKYKEVSSTIIKKGNYNYTTSSITNYILEHNLYLKQQISSYLSESRYKHSISVAKTALLINKNANLGLDKYKVEKAALLHDIAKNLKKDTQYKLMREYYSYYSNSNPNIFHQYLGEYIAREKFFVYDETILNAIKYHTTGSARMSLLEKLIFVSDKIEPTREYNTKPMINACIHNFEKGFKKVLQNNKKYIRIPSNENLDEKSKECYDYYLK